MSAKIPRGGIFAFDLRKLAEVISVSGISGLRGSQGGHLLGSTSAASGSNNFAARGEQKRLFSILTLPHVCILHIIFI